MVNFVHVSCFFLTPSASWALLFGNPASDALALYGCGDLNKAQFTRKLENESYLRIEEIAAHSPTSRWRVSGEGLA
jgi:hypothetical protein